MSERLSTGLDPLDRRIGGGLRRGSLVVVEAPPEAQSEPLVRSMGRGRPTMYATTTRSKEVVEASLAHAEPTAADDGEEGGEEDDSDEFTPDDDWQVVHVGVDEPLPRLAEALEIPTERSAVIVDTVDAVERTADPTAYATFLNDLKESLLETDSIAVLHAVAGESPPALRSRTLEAADVVLQLSVETDGIQVENHLAVPKLRGEEPPEERLKLELGRDVSIDTSRDIA
ncbi:RAD55 family ATPase [Halorubrum gandharaense]